MQEKSKQCPELKVSEEAIERYKVLGHQNPHRAGRDYKDPKKAIQAKMKWYQHKTKVPQDQAEKFGSREQDIGGKGMIKRSMVMPGKYNHHKGKNPGDFLDIPTKGFKGAHFAVYPEKLCEMPIKAGLKAGDIVLDPFTGASTTGVVALKHGRKFIGVDLNEDYLKISKKRLQDTVGTLF